MNRIPSACLYTSALYKWHWPFSARIFPVESGPERIEQEWWLSDGLYRDYYIVEEESGARYWLFRSGPYDGEHPKWFIHGFFA